MQVMSTRFKYLPPDNATSRWGLCLRSVGWQQTSLESEYPIRLHPDEYYYTWKNGRRLSEYQFALVFSGCGVIEFERRKPHRLKEGTLFLLSPRQWHRCRPDEKTGWGTLWIGFNGKMAQPVVREIFSGSKHTIKHLAKAKEFKYAAMRFIAHVLKDGDGRPFTTVGELTHLLGRLADGEFDAESPDARTDIIRNAQLEIAKRYAEVIDFRKLAESFGISYDSFRHRFVAETGMSPLQMQLSEKLRTAKNLIANSDIPIRDIAKCTGFASAAYFTRFFKEATGTPPIEYRLAQSTE